MGHLHCSVIDSDDVEAFAQLGNAFGKSFGGQTLSYRDFGSYEMAPPPEHIWADDVDTARDEGNPFPGLDMNGEEEEDINAFFGDATTPRRLNGGNVIMPWYSEVDAVIATLPKEGNNGTCRKNINE